MGVGVTAVLVALAGGCQTDGAARSAGSAGTGPAAHEEAAAAAGPESDVTAQVEQFARQYRLEESSAASKEASAASTAPEESGRAASASTSAAAMEVEWVPSGDASAAEPAATRGGEGSEAGEAAGAAADVRRDVDESPGTRGARQVAALNGGSVESDGDETTEASTAESEGAASGDPARLSREELLERLAERLAARGDGAAGSLRPYLERAALAALDPRLELTEPDLARLSPASKRVVLAYQRAFTEMGQTLGDSASADRASLASLAEMLDEQLRADEPLRIRKLELCRKVNGYGIYEPFERKAFLAGREHPAIVYVELEHFRTKRQSDGKHRVQLKQEIVLYNESDGLAVWRQRPVSIVDESRNERRDFFVVQIIRLSDRLTVGKYLLKVTVTDEIGRSVDEATLPLRIVTDEALVNR
jgi:hypothetical protein